MASNKQKKEQRTKSVDDDVGETEERIVLRVMEALTDDRILSLLKKALYPQPLDDKLARMNDTLDALTKILGEKDSRIGLLDKKVGTIEEEMDKLE